jgi:hypothetical protein
MGWIESASKDDGYTAESITTLRHYQKAFVDDNFKAKFDMDDTSVVNASVEDDDEVVRWIYKRVVSRRWEGLTESAAASLTSSMLADDNYGQSKANWTPSGSYTVTADYVLYGTDGYTPWIRVEDLPTFEAEE